MFGVGLRYRSSGGLPPLPVKSICLASNPVSFGSEAHGPSRRPRACLSQPGEGSAPSTPAPLSAASCFLTGDSCVSHITSLAPSRGEQLAWQPWAGRRLWLPPSHCSSGKSC